jgi:hypothetical protein
MCAGRLIDATFGNGSGEDGAMGENGDGERDGGFAGNESSSLKAVAFEDASCVGFTVILIFGNDGGFGNREEMGGSLFVSCGEGGCEDTDPLSGGKGKSILPAITIGVLLSACEVSTETPPKYDGSRWPHERQTDTSSTFI